jgi:hypothetical protein
MLHTRSTTLSERSLNTASSFARGPTGSSKHTHRLAALTPAGVSHSGLDLVFVDDRAAFAKASATQFNATPNTRDEVVGNVEVTFDPANADAVVASMSSLRSRR